MEYTKLSMMQCLARDQRNYISFALVIGLFAAFSSLRVLAAPQNASVDAAVEPVATLVDESAYSCPMHPDEVSNAPGSCPICGMFLKAQQAHDQPARHKPSDAVQQDKPAPAIRAKPSLFWESGNSRRISASDYEHPKSGQTDNPTSRRITLEPSLTSGTVEQVTPQSPEARTGDLHLPAHSCPMHPRIVSHDPDGSCPICGMDLVAKSVDPVGAGRPHEHRGGYAVYLSYAPPDHAG